MADTSGPAAPDGAPSYIELCVADADKARTFYGALLGWKMEGDEGPTQASTGGLDIGIHDRDPSSLLEVLFTVNDSDSAVAKLAELGGRTVSEVTRRTPTSVDGWRSKTTKGCDSGSVSRPSDFAALSQPMRVRRFVALPQSRAPHWTRGRSPFAQRCRGAGAGRVRSS